MQNELIKTLVPIVMSFVGGVLGFALGYLNHKRMMVKVHEDISLELLRHRIAPYNELFRNLKDLTSYTHVANKDKDRAKLLRSKDIFHDALYNLVGTLASHDTRQFLRLARLGIDMHLRGELTAVRFRNLIWALHFSLRSDLGIKQPHWDSEIEVIRKKGMSAQREALSQLLKSDYWDFIDIEPVFSAVSSKQSGDRDTASQRCAKED